MRANDTHCPAIGRWPEVRARRLYARSYLRCHQALSECAYFADRHGSLSWTNNASVGRMLFIHMPDSTDTCYMIDQHIVMHDLALGILVIVEPNSPPTAS